MKTFNAVMLLMVLGCTKGSSSDSKDAGPEAHRDEEAHQELPRQVRLEAAMVESAGIRTDVVRRASLAMTVGLPGEIIAEPDRSARLSTAAAGRIDRIMFNEGSLVTKGAVMATLRVPDVGRLRGAWSAATAKARAASANTERMKALRESGLGSEQSLVDAEAEAHSYSAEAKALGDQLGAIGVDAETGSGYVISLRAPISGVVVARDGVVGQPISSDQVLATIVDLSEVWFIGRIFEKDLLRLRVGARADVTLNAFPQEHFQGVVEYVGQQIDPTARTLTARIRLKNADARLRLGLFGSAHIEVSGSDVAAAQLVVPRSAVSEIAGKTVVFVRADDGDFVLHEVALGEAALSSVQILSGVSEGEQIVTHGVFTLKSAVLKSTLSEDE